MEYLFILGLQLFFENFWVVWLSEFESFRFDDKPSEAVLEQALIVDNRENFNSQFSVFE